MQKGQVRSVAMVVLLGIITCGIYSFYWIYATSKEVAVASGEKDNAGMELLLCLVTCGIYMLYWYYKYSQKTVALGEQENAGVDQNLPILALILAVFTVGIVAAAIMQANLNKVWGDNGKTI